MAGHGALMHLMHRLAGPITIKFFIIDQFMINF